MIAYALLWEFPGHGKNDINLIIFVKRKPNVRQRSFDDFLVGPALPLGPTPSANFTNDFGRLVRDRTFAIWTFSLTIQVLPNSSLMYVSPIGAVFHFWIKRRARFKRNILSQKDA